MLDNACDWSRNRRRRKTPSRLLLVGMLLGMGGPATALPADPPLAIHVLNVGKGDALLVVSPAGRTLLIDAGKDTKGAGVIVPRLQALGIEHLDFLVTSHYDRDHNGGTDEVVAGGYLPGIAYDRGEVPPPPAWQEYTDYVAAIGPVRATIQPGDVLDLGGGAIATCVVVNGRMIGGGVVDISGSAAPENSASVGLLIEYGDFSFFTAGDLTGGYSPVFPDVETPLAPLIGDVDAYKLSHHGSSTSTNDTLVAELRPEVSFISSGEGSTLPKENPINRLSPASGATWVFQTGDSASGTIGGITLHDHILLETDGHSYTVSGGEIRPRTFLCDEWAGSLPALPGDLAIGELMADPTAEPVPGLEADYVEITNLSTRWVSLEGSSLAEIVSGTSFTIRSAALLAPRETIVLCGIGDPLRNGGVVASGVWPKWGLLVRKQGGQLTLSGGSGLFDDVNYGSSGSGVARERMNLLHFFAHPNTSDAVAPYGDGDLGTPGKVNSLDATPWPPVLTDLSPPKGPATGGTWVQLHGFDLDCGGEPVVRFGNVRSHRIRLLDEGVVMAQAPPRPLPLAGTGSASPPGPGGLGSAGGVAGPTAETVDVSIQNANGTSVLTAAFTYEHVKQQKR